MTIFMRTVLAACLLALAWPSTGMAMGNKGAGEWISVTGIIRVTGNMPLPRVVLVPQGEDPDRVSKDKLYLVTGDLAKELMERDQNRTVTLSGPSCLSPSPEFQRCIAPREIKRQEK